MVPFRQFSRKWSRSKDSGSTTTRASDLASLTIAPMDLEDSARRTAAAYSSRSDRPLIRDKCWRSNWTDSLARRWGAEVLSMHHRRPSYSSHFPQAWQ